MTEFQSNGKHYLAVQVPDKYVGKEMSIRNGTTLAMNNQRFEFLPHGFQYSILGLASEMSEELWKKVVDNDRFIKGAYKDYTETEYEVFKTGICNCFRDASDSGHSLMKFLKMNPETTLIIEKR